MLQSYKKNKEPQKKQEKYCFLQKNTLSLQGKNE
jgi:hypothetical protein